MVLDADAAYLALRTRDPRFDGRLFVGVTSTGVYCRPVCRVRTPRRENCRFFPTREQAEAASFRPCLKCRPEIAPGLSAMDSSATLAGTAARWIEQAVHAGEAVRLPAIAARLGVTDRHLRRIFIKAHGVPPRDFLATQRLLLAKQLLTDTAEPVAQVALASGFDSLRRFNAAFAERYRMAPTRLRRQRDGGGSVAPTLRLAWRPPYDAEAMHRFFAQRAIDGVEEAGDGLALRRTLAVTHRGRRLAGWIAWRWRPERDEVHLAVAPALAPALGALIPRLRHALDLDADPAPIDAAMPWPARTGNRLPGSIDGFETAARIVLGQQVSVKAARTLTQRLVHAIGASIETPWPGLTHLFPDAATIAAAAPAALGALGIVRQRVGALQALASAVADGRLTLTPDAPLQPTLDALRALPGIGEWTAQMIALRVLAWPDAFPATDIGVLNALGTRDPKLAAAQAEAWRPWRGYAVLQLWHHLETA